MHTWYCTGRVVNMCHDYGYCVNFAVTGNDYEDMVLNIMAMGFEKDQVCFYFNVNMNYKLHLF